MRITFKSAVLAVVAASAFGVAIVAAARLLPSGEPVADPALAVFDVRPQAPGVPAPATAAGAISGPALSAIETPAAPGAMRVLDHHPVDTALRDRNGNAPKRDISHEELMQIARDYDIVEDDLRAQPDGVPLGIAEMQEMRALNPRLRVLRHVPLLTSNDPAFGTIRPDDGLHASWFLRDGSGDVVLADEAVAHWNRQPNFALDPRSPDVRIALAALAHQYVLLGYDGIVLDGLCEHVPLAGVDGSPILLSAPIDASTGLLYTDADWRDAVMGLVGVVRRAAPSALLEVGQ